MPRLADVSDLKKEVCRILSHVNIDLAGGILLPRLKPEHLSAAELNTLTSLTDGSSSNSQSQGLLEIARFLDDREPLAALLESGSASSSSPRGERSILLSENCKDLPFITTTLPGMINRTQNLNTINKLINLLLLFGFIAERLEDRCARIPPSENADIESSIPVSVNPPSHSDAYSDTWEYDHPDALDGK
jgi:hypothetical protein